MTVASTRSAAGAIDFAACSHKECSYAPIAGREELRDGRSTRGSEIEVPARQTGIYEIR